VRYPYRAGELNGEASAEVVVESLPSDGGHWTRDIAFSPDGKTMYVSVGSASNVAEEVEPMRGEELKSFAESHPLGASWGAETDRVCSPSIPKAMASASMRRACAIAPPTGRRRRGE
jgi:glucose/arabinose dehydrogenase